MHQQTPAVLPLSGYGSDQPTVSIRTTTQPIFSRPGRWSPKCAKGVGVALVIVSLISILCNIGWFFIKYSLANVGIGFWGGAALFVPGLLLTLSGFRPYRGLITAALVTSLIAILVDFFFFSVGILQIYDSYGDEYEPVPNDKDRLPAYGFGVLYVAIGVTAFLLLLTASIMSCMTLCATGSNMSYYTIEDTPRSLLPDNEEQNQEQTAAGSAIYKLQSPHSNLAFDSKEYGESSYTA